MRCPEVTRILGNEGRERENNGAQVLRRIAANYEGARDLYIFPYKTSGFCESSLITAEKSESSNSKPNKRLYTHDRAYIVPAIYCTENKRNCATRRKKANEISNSLTSSELSIKACSVCVCTQRCSRCVFRTRSFPESRPLFLFSLYSSSVNTAGR